MVAVVLALGLSIGYVTDLAYGYTLTDYGSFQSIHQRDMFGSGAQTALKHGEYIVYGVDYINSYSSLSCGALDYPIISRIPLLGFYHQESYTGRPTATHSSVVDTKDYDMLGSQSIVGTSATVVDDSILKGDASIAYFQDTYIASFLTGFNGDIVKDSKAMLTITQLFNGNHGASYAHVDDESGISNEVHTAYAEFTEIEGETLRFTLEHTGDVISPLNSNTGWDSSNTITLNGLDDFQDNYFFKAFRILDGVGSIDVTIDRGDIVLSISTLPGVVNDKVVSVYPDSSMGPFNMIDSNNTHIPELHLRYWAVNESAQLETLFTHTTTDDWTALYILKPIYVINGPIVLDDHDIIIPNYAWSNVGFVQCEHSVYNQGLYQEDSPTRSQFAETAVTPVDCQGILDTVLPDNAYVSAIGATMDDLIPHDYCSEEGNSSPTNQPIDIVIPEIATGTMYDDYLEYFVVDITDTREYVEVRPNPDIFPGNSAIFANHTGQLTSEVCTAKTVYGMADIIVTNQFTSLAMFNEVIDGRESFGIYSDDTLMLSCNNLAILYNGTQISLNSFSKEIGAVKPYYLTMIDSINNNDWGWGTFQSTSEDASQPNQYVMGVPFIMVLAILSCMSGFNGRYIIPSIIVYLMLIASFTYLEIISITDGILGGLVMLGLIAIFSKGFR